MRADAVVDPEEYHERQNRARAAADSRGLSALVSFSRGGGAHDRQANGLWLAGVRTPQPYVPDLPDHWRATGHVAVIVPVDGPVTAVVESVESCPWVVADELVVGEDLIAATAAALANCLTPRVRQPVGVLGADVLPYAWWTALEELVLARRPHARLQAADDLSVALRLVKSPAEQRLLRAAGRLGSQAMAEALAAAVPGASEAQVAAAFIKRVVSEGGAIYDVVVSSGAASGRLGPSGGAAGAAGWTTRGLEVGDLLRIDAYGSVAGYLFDFARSIVVGDQASEEQVELIDALRASVMAGVSALRPGVPLSEIVRVCEQTLANSAHARRYGVPDHLMGGFWGHGMGLDFGPPWIGPGNHELVQADWCLALERRASVAGLGGAQYEDNVLIGSASAELLTES